MKNYWIIIIILALVVLGLWAFRSVPPQTPLVPPTQEFSTTTISYTNAEYGFVFKLPITWKEYRIATGTWIGESNGKTITEGPELFIRHPLWSAQTPRQDIPIMIFTLEQWQNLTGEKFHIGAAPIGPSELGRNGTYIFALPARYNFAFPEGFEEVDIIMQGKPLTPLP